ncbi:N-acetylmuramoyl-L-alanine amidase family protein [Desulfosporosinus nitroreducens]|uniref:N-acetylmuramoyl-L-alanine amidase family protein n=1 Tax=Desulfosporosinus nitroreducens TaxID=2018668 RepID=UPI00207C5D3B|nr:N-acetylmuramoyl-L-alanine amidase [Desulfosporosinus nitroreducens]MCO1599745.1 N-acetylmuramoyl-L-alanine amidase [Desulfosporosinus nitroreducens]
MGESKIYDLIFDPGHGGTDPGAVGPTTKEKDNVLVLAKKTAVILEATGRFRVKFTRTTDKDFCAPAPYNDDLDLRNRVKVANTLGGDAFYSFHNNSATVKAYGNEIYALAAGGEGEKMAKAIRARMALLGMVDRGIKYANWYVLKWTEMPAVLIEYGFINSEESTILDKMDQAALAIAQGIGDHFGVSVSANVIKKEVYEMKEAVLAHGIEDYLVPARKESIKLGNCAVFLRFDDKTPPADVFKAEHLTIVGGGSVGHPNEMILSGKTWGDTSAAVSATGA